MVLPISKGLELYQSKYPYAIKFISIVILFSSLSIYVKAFAICRAISLSSVICPGPT